MVPAGLLLLTKQNYSKSSNCCQRLETVELENQQLCMSQHYCILQTYQSLR